MKNWKSIAKFLISILLIVSIIVFTTEACKIIAQLLILILLILTSGDVVRLALTLSSHKPLKDIASENEWDTGFLVGKCENILLFILVIYNAFTALSIVFAAKTIVRIEDLGSDEEDKKSLFYLAGTFVNVTYSILLALLAKHILYFL